MFLIMVFKGGENLKYIKCIACVLGICALFSACNFQFSSSIDDLISPISPIGDNADIKTALDEYVQNGYDLKTPTYGKHITSYTFFDIDGDGEKEAIAFYEPSDDLGTIDMAVIKKRDDAFEVIENIKGKGKDIHSLDFFDVNGSGNKELVVCWDVIRNSSSHEMCVYEVKKKKDKISLSEIGESITVNNYIAVDINNDSVDELLVFKLGNGSSSYAGAEACSYLYGKLRILGETKLDSHISSYNELKVEEIENDYNRVYADAISSSGSSMLTEIVYWSDAYGTIISPFYSYSSGRTKDTARNVMITSRDINSDGIIEVPNDKKLSSLPIQISCIDWKVYKKSILIHTDYTLCSVSDRYTVIIPDKYIDKISVGYDEKTRIMSVSSKDSRIEAFRIVPVLKATYDKRKFEGYTTVLDDSGYYYLAKTGDNPDIDITIKDLKTYIKSI